MRAMRRFVSFVLCHWFALACLALVLSCACFGARSTGASIRHGAVSIGRVVLPLVSDVVWGVWSLACGIVGA